jgi:hypothetical protein
VNEANLTPVDDPQTQDVDESTQPLTVGSLVTNTPPLNYCSSISCWPSENALVSQPIPEPLEGRIIGRVMISDTSFVLVEYNVNYN